MMKPIHQTAIAGSLMAVVFLLSGCSTATNIPPAQHQGIDWWDADCPKVASEDVSPDGHLILRKGKTLACQVARAVSNIPCQGIRDAGDENAGDYVICQDRSGRQSIFSFDKNKILLEHKQLR
ncbi:MAG: hypothetical protein ABN482_02770 [Corticimicrobacter sp.]|uniref:hypothetical protein n=1 Tax=Corticimicrobacter sp. TaxID=2678536 RepID=UPI0032DB5ECA